MSSLLLFAVHTRRSPHGVDTWTLILLNDVVRSCVEEYQFLQDSTGWTLWTYVLGSPRHEKCYLLWYLSDLRMTRGQISTVYWDLGQRTFTRTTGSLLILRYLVHSTSRNSKLENTICILRASKTDIYSNSYALLLIMSSPALDLRYGCFKFYIKELGIFIISVTVIAQYVCCHIAFVAKQCSTQLESVSHK